MTIENVCKTIIAIGWPEVIKESVKAVIETHLKPILKKYKDYKDEPEYLEDCLAEYLEISYKKVMLMNTIVFRGIQKTVYDLYIPLTLVHGDSLSQSEENSYIVDTSYADCFMENNNVLIVDTAGMGKSTIVKYMYVQAINNNDYIPIIIELRKVDQTKEILDYILEQFELLDKSINKADMIKMLKRGDFIIFFDGYDEITNENRGGVLDNIQQFVKKAGNNKYFLTSRDEWDLACLSEFTRFSIKPLSMDEAFKLIRKYDNNGEKSENLIQRIKKDNQLEILKEFLINPMLVSLLYKTFEYKEEIAYKKLSFYSQIYDALFNDHDKTKGGAYVHPKKTQLDILDFEKLLRRIAFISLKNNQVEYSRQALADIIGNSVRDMSWVSVSVADVLDDLTHAIPLFQKDGNDYRWVHKSFMEYFAAGFICYDSERTEQLFEKMSNSQRLEKYKNVLDFCYDMKPDIARRILIYPHICKFIEEYNNKYVSEVFSSFDQNLLDYRKSISFTHEFLLVHYKNTEAAEEEFKNKKRTDIIYVNNGRKMTLLALFQAPDLVLSRKKRNLYLNDLLLCKNIDAFKSVKIREYDNVSMDIEEGEYTVSDDARLKLNKNKEYFEYVTKLLMTTVSDVPYLDYSKCVILKEKIEKEIEEKMITEKEFDFL